MLGVTAAAATATSLTVPGLAVADTTTPTPVSGLRVSDLSFNAASVAWNPATDDSGWVQYVIEVRNGTEYLQRFGVLDTARSFDDLGQGRTYTATVWARDGANNESAPVSIQFTTPVDTQAPAAPANLRAVQQNGEFTAVAWNAAADNSAPLTYVLRSGTQPILFTTALDITVFELVFIQCRLEPGSVHTLTVQAVDLAGNQSPLSNAITVQFPIAP